MLCGKKKMSKIYILYTLKNNDSCFGVFLDIEEEDT